MGRLAKGYTKVEGVEVSKCSDAASGTMSRPESEISKTEAPTLYQVNGPAVTRTEKNTPPTCPKRCVQGAHTRMWLSRHGDNVVGCRTLWKPTA